MSRLNILIVLLVIFACNIENKEEKVYLPGTADLTYDATTHTFYFPGSGEGATLFIDHKLRGEEVDISEAGSYKLKYPGEHLVHYYIDGEKQEENFTFFHDHNDGAAFDFQYNPPNATLGNEVLGELNDGFRGNKDPGDGQWLIWDKEDVEVNVDLGEKKMINRIELSYYDDVEQKIYPPKSIIVTGSYDGDKYFDILNMTNISGDGIFYNRVTLPINNDFRYYKFQIDNYYGSSLAEDQNCYLLLDEIVFFNK